MEATCEGSNRPPWKEIDRVEYGGLVHRYYQCSVCMTKLRVEEKWLYLSTINERMKHEAIYRGLPDIRRWPWLVPHHTRPAHKEKPST